MRCNSVNNTKEVFASNAGEIFVYHFTSASMTVHRVLAREEILLPTLPSGNGKIFPAIKGKTRKRKSLLFAQKRRKIKQNRAEHQRHIEGRLISGTFLAHHPVETSRKGPVSALNLLLKHHRAKPLS